MICDLMLIEYIPPKLFSNQIDGKLMVKFGMYSVVKFANLLCIIKTYTGFVNIL